MKKTIFMGLSLLALLIPLVAGATNDTCVTEGGFNKTECAKYEPTPWTYALCDTGGTTHARSAAWCWAYGLTPNGAGDCSGPQLPINEGSMLSISTSFIYHLHGCPPNVPSDHGWGQTFATLNCSTVTEAPLFFPSGNIKFDARTIDYSGFEGVGCTSAWSETIYGWKGRSETCPVGYQPGFRACVRKINCPCHMVGDPTRVSDGQEILWETDYASRSGGLLQYRRVYKRF